MPRFDLTRRQLLSSAAALGMVAMVRPLDQARAAMMPSPVGQDTGWFRDGKLRYRRDGMAKVTGSKVFALDLRARDLEGWPDQQSHALLIMIPRADAVFEGLDLSMLGDGLQPDVLVDHARLSADGVSMSDPEFYGELMLAPGQVSPMLGQPVAMGIWHDYERFRAAQKLLRFNPAIFRFGAAGAPPARPSYGAAQFVRIGGDDPRGPDRFSPFENGTIWPELTPEGVIWPGPDHAAFGEARRLSAELRARTAAPPQGWHVISRHFSSQSVEPAAMEMENGLAWHDTANGTLHVIGATQSPYTAAGHILHMLDRSSFQVGTLDFVTGYTVGYGQKEHHSFPNYVAVAGLYAEGRPVRLALDRWQHFQFALKRHPFETDLTIACDAEGRFQTFICDMVGDGGGVQNFSPSVGTVAVTAAQSAYYFPTSDLSADVRATINVTAGSMRGYGTVQSMAATEMLVDELAAETGRDAIALRRLNVLKSGMKNTQGLVPAGHLRMDELLALAEQEPLWIERAERKARFEAENPGMLYGVGFASSQKNFGTGAEAAIVQLEITPDGRTRMRHIASEIGAGATTSQMLVVQPQLGRPVDEVEFSVQHWPQMPVHTEDNPYEISQDEEDALARDPTWVPRITSPRSASNSAYYFTHATQQAAQMLLRLGLWPAALSIWSEGAGGGQTGPEPVALAEARWTGGMLTARSLEPLSHARLAERAHRDGLVTGVCIHTFNRWSWAEADFDVEGELVSAPIDALSVQWGQGASAARRARMTAGGYAFIPRSAVRYPPVARNDGGPVYYAPCATLLDLSVARGTGEVRLLSHKTWLECGTQIVPELVSGQLQGGVAMGIGHALYEELPLGPDGPGNGTWGWSRYRVPRAAEVAVWTQTGHVLPPLSEFDPPKGMAEVTMIPVVAACANAICHATGHRFYRTPVTAERIRAVL